jgi:hypothetical protein
VLQRFLSSEAPTDLNSDGREKLRAREWLISAILREISQLSRRGVSRDALPLDGRDAHPYTTHRLQSKILSRLET